MNEKIFGDWSSEAADEFDEYVQQPVLQNKDLHSLAWWLDRTQQTRWPKLSVLAVTVLSFPPMSDEAERVFSGARRTISWDRCRLMPDIIEAAECLKHYYRTQTDVEI
jgi:hAT family C-terminal dimerisation region